MIDFEEVASEPVFDYEYIVDDIEMLAKYYIDLYFSDLEFNVDKSVLHSKKYVSMVLNLDICKGMDLIYQLIGVDYSPEQMRQFERQGQLPDDVKYVISTFKDFASKGIPKEFAAGIFVMYLELCEGHKIAA